MTHAQTCTEGNPAIRNMNISVWRHFGIYSQVSATCLLESLHKEANKAVNSESTSSDSDARADNNPKAMSPFDVSGSGSVAASVFSVSIPVYCLCNAACKSWPHNQTWVHRAARSRFMYILYTQEACTHRCFWTHFRPCGWDLSRHK